MRLSDFSKKRILAFGDSNTYGYDTLTDGRYGDDERWPRVLERLLGDGYTVIEEGLPGRTAVFEDPFNEGLCGIRAITPCMRTHMPLDTVIIMLGTNETKERFCCNARMIASGIMHLADKAIKTTEAWRGKPDVLIVVPPPISAAYREGVFCAEMGEGCDIKSEELARELEHFLPRPGVRMVDSGSFEGVEMLALDGMHLTCEAHTALAAGLSRYIAGNN